MAYIRDVTRICPECKKPATHEVVNWLNAACGTYCLKHAEAKRKIIQKAEDGK